MNDSARIEILERKVEAILMLLSSALCTCGTPDRIPPEEGEHHRFCKMTAYQHDIKAIQVIC